ncbi:DoxX family membrane protein [Luteolibacter sp. GHJ8]|uniref:DoxX family membrane protein n=1 Tax=Luteolibacter rhizosphaerae TaxID=2989719 RepID=A0ABT3G8X3_9BACT|nr:DoxX family membrane protein [Luteolibacter rhizosphaerae]MCW1916298.1 DoxX family membrane protein [Luteolibacter rhizosphaerae]
MPSGNPSRPLLDPSRSRTILGIVFVLAGINHFRVPALYESMIPPYLPWPSALNLISGAAEILGGLGILVPAFRRPAAWGLIALLVAVFPANLHMALHGLPGKDISPWILWLRLPFQAVFIYWVYRSCLSGADDPAAKPA